ncbi:hypothetical protein AKJ36_02015, partial [candidate division MSBL1 archaeon SCGC-AAA259I07]
LPHSLLRGSKLLSLDRVVVRIFLWNEFFIYVAYGKSSWRGAFIQLIVIVVIVIVIGIVMSLIGIGIGFLRFFPF